jgi:uncharacterized protein involved in response to NO
MAATTPDFATGRLWLLLTAFLYVVFTLLPDSHSLMVSWPWVAIWQIALLCPILWLLSGIWHRQKLALLGNGFDIAIAILLLGLLLSSLFAPFPQPARWYSWGVVGLIAALYALHQWIVDENACQRRYGLASFQGYLAIAFILLSLFLWTTQTFLPELSRINALNSLGLSLSFDFSVLERQNWAPLGHQNYVAGYLILALPLLLGLGILAKDWQRWLWFAGVGCGLLDLYTTSSRGGWLGLAAVCVFGLVILAFQKKIPKIWLGLAALAIFSLFAVIILTNTRLNSLLTSFLQGQGDAYRQINTLIGWRMGSAHPLTGIGLGNVPLAYQSYRPITAGRFSEWIYQLHSTPAQLWAELGLWGIITALLVIFGLIYHFSRLQAPKAFSDRVLLWCFAGGFIGYGLVSLIDYQFDNLAIAGTLVIYLASITSYLQKEEKILPIPPKTVFFTGLGVTIAMVIWLVPIHRAWQISSLGFAYLRANRIEPFRESLVKAGELAPWEPYYPFQLGWNLGNIALTSGNPNALTEGITHFQRGNQISPDREFGHSNLGWLLLKTNPAEARKEFQQSIRIIPAKRSVFDGLARSLFAQGQTDLAIEALALEGVRDPLFITNPVWRSPQLQSIYAKILDRQEAIYNRLLQDNPSPGLQNYLYSSRGSLYWWRGDRAKAAADWQKSGNSLGLLLLNPQRERTNLPAGVDSILKIWDSQTGRLPLLRKAWLEARQEALLPDMERELVDSIAASPNLETWLREKAPARPYNRQILGFGVNSRHIDGPQPFDFAPVVENLAIATWFDELFTSPDYSPEFDTALQPFREKLIGQTEKLS